MVSSYAEGGYGQSVASVKAPEYHGNLSDYLDSPIEPSPVKFPVVCPHCRATTGFPFMATTTKVRADAVRLGMRCRACQFEWEFDFLTQVDNQSPIYTDD